MIVRALPHMQASSGSGERVGANLRSPGDCAREAMPKVVQQVPKVTGVAVDEGVALKGRGGEVLTAGAASGAPACPGDQKALAVPGRTAGVGKGEEGGFGQNLGTGMGAGRASESTSGVKDSEKRAPSIPSSVVTVARAVWK